MDFSHRLAISYYKTIAVINESHNIYLVQHQETKQIFIKKILDVFNADIYERLYNNPVVGTPKIIHYAKEDDKLIVIEEFISGISLQEKMDKKALTISDIMGIIQDLSDILEKLHFQSPAIIHRDIKPSNVIITNYNRAVLLDFNAAKFYSSDAIEDTVLLGTHGYAAPEQYGFGSSSPQTDIYSLGILLREMLNSIYENSSEIDTIIRRCTQMNPAERYADIREFRKEIDALVHPKTDSHKSRDWHKYILPGYRTRTPWKMLLATTSYLFITWICMTIEIKDTYGLVLWIERVFLYAIMLFMIFGSFNYLDVQKAVPLCKFKNPILRGIGIIILITSVTFCLLIIMFIIESIFAPFR